MTPARVRFIEDQEVSDPYGDLKVIVGTQNKKASILVSSAVFRDASSKLKAMISAAYGDTSPLVVQGEGMAWYVASGYDSGKSTMFTIILDVASDCTTTPRLWFSCVIFFIEIGKWLVILRMELVS